MKLLPDDGGQLLEEPEYFGVRTFLKQALERFPELADDPDIAIGIHLSMSALGRLLVSTVRAGQLDKARAIVGFLERVLSSPRLDPEIPNAVTTSFVDVTQLEAFPNGQHFLESMPPPIRELLR